MTNTRDTQKLEELIGYVNQYGRAQQALNGFGGETPEEQSTGRAKAVSFLESPRDKGGEGLQVNPATLDERLRDDVAGVYHQRRGSALAFYTANSGDIIDALEDSQLAKMALSVPGSKNLAKKYEGIVKAEKPLKDLLTIIQTYSTKNTLTSELERDTKETLASLAEKIQKELLGAAKIDKRFTALALQMSRQRAYALTVEGVKKFAEETSLFYAAQFEQTLVNAKSTLADYGRAKLNAYAQDKPDEAMDLTAQISQIKD